MATKFVLKPIEETDEEKKLIDISSFYTPMTESVNIRISAETKKSLEQLAKEYNVSMSEIARQLMEQGLELVNRQK